MGVVVVVDHGPIVIYRQNQCGSTLDAASPFVEPTGPTIRTLIFALGVTAIHNPGIPVLILFVGLEQGDNQCSRNTGSGCTGVSDNYGKSRRSATSVRQS